MGHTAVLRIGERLVKECAIQPADLEAALRQQKRCGSPLGKVLVGQGKLSAYRFHRTLAVHLGLPFADMRKEPCDPKLFRPEHLPDYLALQAMPWKREGRTILLATPEITPALTRWAQRKYRKNHAFAITSPLDIVWGAQLHSTREDDQEAQEILWDSDPVKSARMLFSTPRGKYFVGTLLATVLALMLYVDAFFLTLFIGLNLFYAMTLICKLMFFGSGLMAMHRAEGVKPGIVRGEKGLPIYTILIPLFKEKQHTIENLIISIRAMDYPKARLDVKLIVETEDIQTIGIIQSLRPESWFEIIRVPHSLPQTKPKACNYALRFARGEYVTIYDAEDKPDPLQLRKVLYIFRHASEETACVQARLNYYNYNENILTRMFALEYGSWFNFMLRGLQLLRVPIPLGGTSNHFQTQLLRDVYAWDPYNVTEDADLGIRLAQYGYTSAIVDSTTLEEAPLKVRSWLKQRSRWIKGYMQTYLVHMRQPVKLYKALGFRSFFGFIFFVGAPVLVFLTMPFVVLMSVYAFFQGIPAPGWFFYCTLGNFLAGIVAHIAIALIVVERQGVSEENPERRWRNMVPYCALFPFYWVLHSIASFKAAWQLVHRPHYWEKTEHGLSKVMVEKVLEGNAPEGKS